MTDDIWKEIEKQRKEFDYFKCKTDIVLTPDIEDVLEAYNSFEVNPDYDGYRKKFQEEQSE